MAENVISNEHIVVVDIGSGLTKAGLLGDAPQVIFPTVVGRPRGTLPVPNPGVFIGVEAIEKRGVLALKRPVEHGIVTNWDDYEKILHDVFYRQLRVTPEDNRLVMVECELNPKANREKATQVAFETFNCLGFYTASQEVFALHAAGHKTGVVISLGDGVCHTVPIYEGHGLRHSILRFELAGRDITDYLMRILTDRGYDFTTSVQREIVRDIKERVCYVAQDLDQELELASKSSSLEKLYDQPPYDKEPLVVGNERFRAPEGLFKPSQYGMSMSGISDTLYNTIMRCDKDLRPMFFSNIVLAGGCSLLPGLGQRLKKELVNLVAQGQPVEVLSPPDRQHSAWIGASMMASQASPTWWISKEEYDEYGPTLVNRKCV